MAYKAMHHMINTKAEGGVCKTRTFPSPRATLLASTRIYVARILI